MKLNIVGELSRSGMDFKLSEYEKTAEYAELNRLDEIQMFYKQGPLDAFKTDSKIIWYYLSYNGMWSGSSDDMSLKRLLKLVD